MRISYGAVLPLPPEEAFAFVADPVNWPLFVPSVRSVHKDDDWGQVGGQAHLTSVVFGRSVTMDLELTEWDPPRSFRYTVSQGGKPGNDDNRRTFEQVAGGTRLTGTTEIPARPGLARLLDRLQMRVVRRVFTAGMSVAIGATIRGYVSWNSPQDRSIECRVMKPCSVAIASGWPLPTNAGGQTAASCPLLSR